MDTKQYSTEAAEYALRKMADFTSVQISEDKPLDEQLEAIQVLSSSLGLSDEIKVMVADWIDLTVGPQHTKGAVFLGLLLGLSMAEFHEEG